MFRAHKACMPKPAVIVGKVFQKRPLVLFGVLLFPPYIHHFVAAVIVNTVIRATVNGDYQECG
jgi:hypothetical protein